MIDDSRKRTLAELVVSSNLLVRKGAAVALRAHRRFEAVADSSRPAAIANGVPKAGTHLLEDVLSSAGYLNSGLFVSDYGSSLKIAPVDPARLARKLSGLKGAELVRGHIGYSDNVSGVLASQDVHHFLVIRDPRAIAVSEAHYVRNMNRRHRAHRYYSGLTVDECITSSILGFKVGRFSQDNLVGRLGRFTPWLSDPRCRVVRFESLVELSPAARLVELDVDGRRDVVERARPSLVTYRSPSRLGWREIWTGDHQRAFEEIGGIDLIDAWGFER